MIDSIENFNSANPEKEIIYGINPVYRSIANDFASLIKQDPVLSAKIKDIYLYGSVPENKPNPSDIDIYIETADLSEEEYQNILDIKTKCEQNLEKTLKEKFPEALNQGYNIPILIEINKPKIWEQVTKWHKSRLKL